MHVPTRLLALVELFGEVTFIIASGACSTLTDKIFALAYGLLFSVYKE